jgi:hypothetical protein
MSVGPDGEPQSADSSSPSTAGIHSKTWGIRELLTCLVFVGLVGGWTVANRIVTPPIVSQAERRTLATMPDLSLTSVASGTFMSGFEKFAADSFAGREPLRTLKAWTVLYPLAQLDKSGLYQGDSGVGRFEPLNVASATKVSAKIATVANDLDGLNIYYAFVPDKSIYAGRYLPGFDPQAAKDALGTHLADYTFIDLTQVLGADSFYRTDLHWDQTTLDPVVRALGDAMDFLVDLSTETRTAGEFSGVYAGQLALPVAPDQMTYRPLPNLITAEYLDVTTLTTQLGQVYDLEAFAGQDPYDLFLSGAQPIVRLTNPNATTDRELFLFRDSFGSSLAPLLALDYARVTCIDLRYINWRLVPDFVTFPPGSDVLFLYSSQILNSEAVLQVQGP